ncbi:HEPN domain-containing protein [Bacteroides sp. GD17]|jgi:uncharacterized protein (UPF0332 family)|uniref:HEPN domain-containing protein n=1 Tax=Bacteroides sp. GD17 TaxID=3139826 RepID=UPI0025E245BB|nr:HEPN domain-containing protein [uncultured Bacteroides sp.]
MKLSEEEKKSLMMNRMNRALETWEETKGIINNEFWYAAANRMYYACYYMTTALLIKQGYTASTHSGVIRLFGQYFVSTGIVSREMGRLYSKVYELRQSGDYDDWISIGKEDILPLVASVDEYLKALKKLIDE